MHVIAYSGLSMYPPRRPWSPDPYDPLPSITHVHHSRQDPSDVSVEALDLAAEPVSPLPTVPSSSRYHSRRHFSLPPPSDTTFARPVQSVDSEIDISRFPVWSRDWYTSTKSIPRLNSPPDIYTPLPVSQFNFSANPSPFDLAYKHKEGPSVYEHLSSPFAHDASRDILPWSSDPSNNGTPLDASVKEERIRMLEHEFGPQNKSKSHSNIQDGLDENGNPVIGSVDEKGKLVTQGPKKRIALRVLQIFLTLAAGVPSIYAALVIKPIGTPPPSGKPPAFVLYILSVITLPLLLYCFLFRPCCCQGRRRKSSLDDPLGGGMMVLPVQAIPGKNKREKGKRGGKKGANAEQDNVHVNLIVDPHMFRKDDDDDESDDAEWNESTPGTYDRGPGRKKRTTRRRSVFVGLAMEEDWKRARSFAKKLSALDVAGLTLWGAAFVFILIGTRCPAGSFGGWCNAYNVSSAAACLLSVAFGASTFLDVKDLHDSKMSPRTRV